MTFGMGIFFQWLASQGGLNVRSLSPFILSKLPEISVPTGSKKN